MCLHEYSPLFKQLSQSVYRLVLVEKQATLTEKSTDLPHMLTTHHKHLCVRDLPSTVYTLAFSLLKFIGRNNPSDMLCAYQIIQRQSIITTIPHRALIPDLSALNNEKSSALVFLLHSKVCFPLPRSLL